MIWLDLIWFVLFLFCFVFVLFLFCFVLFCFVLFCFVLFCFVLFCFVLLTIVIQLDVVVVVILLIIFMLMIVQPKTLLSLLARGFKRNNPRVPSFSTIYHHHNKLFYCIIFCQLQSQMFSNQFGDGESTMYNENKPNTMTKTQSRSQITKQMSKDGNTLRTIAHALQISESTAKGDAKRPEKLIRKKRSLTELTPTMKSRIIKLVHGKAKMATRNATDKLKERGQQVRHMTVWRAARDGGVAQKKDHKTFRVTYKQASKKRLQYAKSHLDSDLSKYIFLDESSVNPLPHQTTKTMVSGWNQKKSLICSSKTSTPSAAAFSRPYRSRGRVNSTATPSQWIQPSLCGC